MSSRSDAAAPSPRRLAFTLATMVLCWGLCCFIACSELPFLPAPTMQQSVDDAMLQHARDAGCRVPSLDPDYSIRLHDGELSALEGYLMVVGMLFGFMRTVDLFRLWGWR